MVVYACTSPLQTCPAYSMKNVAGPKAQLKAQLFCAISDLKLLGRARASPTLVRQQKNLGMAYTIHGMAQYVRHVAVKILF